MNIDLDYFFCEPEEGGPAVQMIVDGYIQELAAIVRRKINEGTIVATTTCLTPDVELAGGWASAE